MSNIKWSNEKSINEAIKKFNELENEKYGSLLFHLNNASWHFSRIKQEAWKKIIEDFISKNNFKKVYKFQSIENIFNNLYSELVNDNKFNFGKALISQLDILKEYSTKDHTFYFKVKNIKFDKPYTFKNITIGTITSNDDQEEELIKPLRDFINKLKNDNQQEVAKIWEEIKSSIEGSVIVIKVKGDNEFSKELALEQARSFLNEIQFFTSTTYFFSTLPCLEIDSPINSKFLMQNDHVNKLTYKNFYDKPISNFYISLDDTSNLNEWNNELIKRLKKYNFPIFKNYPEKDEIASRISTAINWYSKAMKSNIISSKFLFCCIGLESLFSVNQNAPVTQTLVDSCALLLGKTIEERKSIKTIIQNIYKQRSGIAHGRNPYIEEIEFKRISLILAEAIYKLFDLKIENQWLETSSFTDFLEDLKFDSSEFQ